MAHLDALDDAITDITKGQKRDKRSKKKRKIERQAASREGTFRAGATQADEWNKGEDGVSIARDGAISHGGRSGHEQVIDRITTPSLLKAEAPHPPDSNLMAETHDDVDRTLSDGSTLAGVASDIPIDAHTPRSSFIRQGLMRVESGNHVVPRTTHENTTNHGELKKKKAQIYFMRHRIQKVLMSAPDEIPNEEVRFLPRPRSLYATPAYRIHSHRFSIR
jgi:hypothetical protein